MSNAISGRAKIFDADRYEKRLGAETRLQRKGFSMLCLRTISIVKIGKGDWGVLPSGLVLILNKKNNFADKEGVTEKTNAEVQTT